MGGPPPVLAPFLDVDDNAEVVWIANLEADDVEVAEEFMRPLHMVMFPARAQLRNGQPRLPEMEIPALLKHHDWIDVRTPAGLQKWQARAIRKVNRQFESRTRDPTQDDASYDDPTRRLERQASRPQMDCP